MLPTFIAHRIIYGSFLETGYIPISRWFWGSPSLFSVLFSANHGLLSWTPVLLFAVIGPLPGFAFWRSVPRVGGAFLFAAIAFYYFIASYPDWEGISSYGNRFFVSLTPLFIVGLAVFLDRFTRVFRSPRVAFAAASIFLACFVFWNAGLMFQWGTHLIPARGPISFSEMIRNQFVVVPRQISAQLEEVFVWPQSHDAADRTARPRAAQTESSSSMIPLSFPYLAFVTRAFARRVFVMGADGGACPVSIAR